MGTTLDSSLNRNTPRSLRPALLLCVAGVFMPLFGQNLLLLVFLIWAWMVRPKGEPWGKIGLLGLSQLLLWVWTLISVLWSYNCEEAITKTLSKVQWVVWPLAFMALRPWMVEQRRWFARCIWVSALFVSGICIVDVLWRSRGPVFWFQDMVYDNLARVSGLDPAYLGMWILLALVAYGQDQVMPRQNHERKVIAWHTAYLLFTVVMVTLLSSRMAMLTGLAMMGVFLIILLRLRKFRWSIAGGLTMLILIPWLLIQGNTINRTRVGEMMDLKADYSTNHRGSGPLRIALWKNTLKCYASNPIFGTGVGDFQDDIRKVYRQNKLEIGYVNQFNSHNQYLQTLATLGPLGLLLLLMILLYPLWQAWKHQQWEALMVFVILLMSMVSESTLERQKGLYIVGLLSNGYFGELLQRGTPTQTHVNDPPKHAT